MANIFPVFALYVPEQTIQIEFRVTNMASALQDGTDGT